ncbi:MAG: MBL fold metallo-hydrolase [Candidatus Zixiibacteriota bacterium]
MKHKIILSINLMILFIYPFSIGVSSDAEKSIKIRWFGQSSFRITTSIGTTIVIDPVNFKGYHIPDGTTADFVTISHEHIDHNSVDALSGSPRVFRGTDKQCQIVNPIDTTIDGIRLYTVSSFHNPGHNRFNAIFVFEFDGIRMAHLGDIGTILADDQIKAIGEIDILMIPVGGQYTIAGPEADSIVNQLNVKRAIIPMHYKTKAFEDLPYTVEPFLKNKENIRRIDDNNFILKISQLPVRREYIVMQY